MIKKYAGIILGICVSFFLFSCATAIKDAEPIPEYNMQSTNPERVQMEFIGYKADTTLLSTTPETIKTYTVMSPYDQWKAISDTPALRKIGTTLQNKNIANDQSFAYFGIYSLQELELYKSRTRYITFIEVTNNKYTINDNGLNKQYYGITGGLYLGLGILEHIGAVIIPEKGTNAYGQEYSNATIKGVLHGCGVAMDIAGLVSIISGITKAKTKITFEGSYNIYIYDTQVKEIIYKDSVIINSSDSFEGSYLMFKESQTIVNNYYGKLISNEILKKYDAINQWLKTR